MADRFSPVGVFDSGVGGVSVLGSLMNRMPGEDFLYYGDTANAPYGTKPEAEVLAHVRRIIDTLLARDVKAIVIACNTATSIAAETLRSELSLPIIGMEPALKPASELHRGGQILVMATPNTLRLAKFRRLMERYGRDAVPVPCPGLMELVERRDWSLAESYLRELLVTYDPSTLDAVVLGCTHYVFLRPILRRLLPSHVYILDGNEGTARQTHRVLERNALLSPNAEGHAELLTSGEPAIVLPVMLSLLDTARSLG